MRKNREVWALDFAVCILLYRLDFIFTPRVNGWQSNHTGLSFWVEKPDQEETMVSIRPFGWPRSSWIECFFKKIDGRWLPQEGCIAANHISPEGWIGKTFKVKFRIGPKTKRLLFTPLIQGNEESLEKILC